MLNDVLKSTAQKLVDTAAVPDITKAQEITKTVAADTLGVALEDVGDVMGTLHAQREMFKANQDAFSKISEHLDVVTKRLEDAQSESRAKTAEESEALRNQEALTELKKHLGRSDFAVSDDKQLEVLKKIQETYGTTAMLYAVETDGMTKALEFSHADGSELKAAAKALSAIHVALVCKGYLQVESVGEMPLYSINPALQGAKGREMVIKAIDAMADSARGESGYDWELAKNMILSKSDIQVDSPGFGGEWLPNQTSTEVITEMWERSTFGSLFRRVPMSSKTLRMPKVNGKLRMYAGDSPQQLSQFFATTGPASRLQSGEVSLQAKTMVGMVGWQQDLEDDAMFPFAQQLQESWNLHIPRQADDAFLNGCISETGLDNAGLDGYKLWRNTVGAALQNAAIQDTSAGLDHRSLFDGIRQYAATHDAEFGTRVSFGGSNHWESEANAIVLRTAFAKMEAKLGLFADGAAWIFSPQFLATLLVWIDHLTMDKVGDKATLLNGLPVSVFGRRVIRCADQKNFYNASGVFDGTTMTKSLVHLVNPLAFVIGDRKRLSMTASSRTFLPGLNALGVHMRMDFKAIHDPNVEGMPVVEGYNANVFP